MSANLEFKRTVQICRVDCRSIIHLDSSAASVSTQVDVNPSTASDPALSFSFFVEVIVVGHTPGHVFWLFWPVAGASQAQARLMIFRPSETSRLSLPAERGKVFTQHTSANVSIRQPANISIRQPAYVSIRQHAACFIGGEVAIFA